MSASSSASLCPLRIILACLSHYLSVPIPNIFFKNGGGEEDRRLTHGMDFGKLLKQYTFSWYKTQGKNLSPVHVIALFWNPLHHWEGSK